MNEMRWLYRIPTQEQQHRIGGKIEERPNMDALKISAPIT